MPIFSPKGDQIATALVRAGIREAPVETLMREGRLAAILPGDRIAWFPRNREGHAALALERRVLRLIERYCSFAAPRVLHEDVEGWDVRSMVPGVGHSFNIHERARQDHALATRIGMQLGCILADQHTNVPACELEEWLPALPNWPRMEDIPKLPLVVADRALLGRIERALTQRESLAGNAGKRVLTHSDLAFHNIAFEPSAFDVAGVFDYQGAAFSDRHLDFKNLSLHCADGSEPLLGAAAAVYEQITGISIDLNRVLLLNATEAVGFLGFRFGHAPEEEWYGRTLSQDLEWADTALRVAGIRRNRLKEAA